MDDLSGDLDIKATEYHKIVFFKILNIKKYALV